MKTGIDISNMKAPLAFGILWIVGRRPCTGREIFDEMEKRRGKRPSCGTIYPVLKKFCDEGFIDHTGEHYIITDKGMIELKKGCKIMSKAFYDFDAMRDYAAS